MRGVASNDELDAVAAGSGGEERSGDPFACFDDLKGPPCAARFFVFVLPPGNAL